MDTHLREHDIHVRWLSDRQAWLVTHGSRPMAHGNFRRRAYAMAFARAVAASRDVELIESDSNGRITRYARGTLSYPTRLD